MQVTRKEKYCFGLLQQAICHKNAYTSSKRWAYFPEQTTYDTDVFYITPTVFGGDAEELSGILHGIVGDYGADFWAEKKPGKIKLHLVTDAFLDMEMRSGLTKMSSSGKNDEAKEIMGKIQVFVAECISNYQETTQYCMQNGTSWKNQWLLIWQMT